MQQQSFKDNVPFVSEFTVDQGICAVQWTIAGTMQSTPAITGSIEPGQEPEKQ